LVSVSGKYLYVREGKRPNSGPEIDRWLAYLGLSPGNPYCAAYVIGCSYEASMNLGVEQPLPRIGRVSSLWKAARKNPYKYKTVESSRVKQGIEKLQPGDIAIWSYGKLPGNSNWNGHTGVVVQQHDRNTFEDNEGNTSSGKKGSQRDGDGVFKRKRTLGIGTRFPVEGFIRVK
jgi:hypothetical protein